MISIFNAILLTILTCHHLNVMWPAHMLGVLVAIAGVIKLIEGANKTCP